MTKHNSHLHPTVDREIERHLAQKYEGKVLVSVYMIHMGGQWSIMRDYYHVKEGKIWLLSQYREPELMDDTFLQLSCDCMVVGKFNPKYKYKSSVRNYNYKQIKRLL